MLWNSDPSYCRPIFSALMSPTRFKQITAFMKFDHFVTREMHREQDRLTPIRDVFDPFVENCKKAYNPATHLTVDEQLVYLEKEGNQPEKNHDQGDVVDMVQNLQPVYGITVDQFFISLPLADALLARNVTVFGT